jgi:hypothetical protein
MLNSRERDSLDRYITGNYGEDQFSDEPVTVAENHRVAFKALKARCVGSRRYLDMLYGPDAKELRSDIASHLHGAVRIPKSDKRCQYGNLRRALVEAIGATGECIAAVDSDFQNRVEALE